MQHDILVRGGTVVDPSQSIHRAMDVAIHDGVISALLEPGEAAQARHTIDARDCLVTPGLIDLHVHVYPHCPLGLHADPLSAAGGVTTMLDAGSAGSNNFDMFRSTYLDRLQTRVLGLVNLSRSGLVAAELGELMDRRQADAGGVVRTIRRNPGVAVGVKIRAGAHIIGRGKQAWDNLHDAIHAARESATWLMVHIGECPMSVPELLAELAPGDCLTHCFKAGSTRITDDTEQLFDEVREARERGIIFDVGHGNGSFSWAVAEQALAAGFEPNTVSTDLHVKNLHGPVYDLPTTMSKLLLLGVPLERVVAMATSRAAAVLGKAGELGTLRVGSVADVAVFEQLEGRFRMADSYGRERLARRLLVAAATVRQGELLPGGGGRRMCFHADD